MNYMGGARLIWVGAGGNHIAREKRLCLSTWYNV